MDYRSERGKMLLSRRNQLLLEFSFWNEPVPRAGSNIYELRSYQLRVTVSYILNSSAFLPVSVRRLVLNISSFITFSFQPGTMIEWGNYW